MKNKRARVCVCVRAYSCSICTQYYRWNVLRFEHDIFLCLWLVNCLLNTNRTTVINMYLHGVYNVKCSIVNCYYIILLHSPSAVHVLRAWARHITRNYITYTAKGFGVTSTTTIRYYDWSWHWTGWNQNVHVA